MSYPDAINMRALDASMGSTREADRQTEMATIRRCLAQMQEAANALRLVEGLGWWIDSACHDAGDAVEAEIERIGAVLP
jgi:hypothetical protein